MDSTDSSDNNPEVDIEWDSSYIGNITKNVLIIKRINSDLIILFYHGGKIRRAKIFKTTKSVDRKQIYIMEKFKKHVGICSSDRLFCTIKGKDYILVKSDIGTYEISIYDFEKIKKKIKDKNKISEIENSIRRNIVLRHLFGIYKEKKDSIIIRLIFENTSSFCEEEEDDYCLEDRESLYEMKCKYYDSNTKIELSTGL
jgi:hypothetical protein